jgi:sporulation protein YlmC with PRC-barrel domain
MNARIKSPDGTTLGRIRDVVLAPDLDGISYVALSRGMSWYAVPYSALSPGINDTFVVPITEQQLKSSRGFNPRYWPASADASWALLSSGTGSSAMDEPYVDSQSVENRRFSKIKGDRVKAMDGENAGRIRDLVVALDSGRITHTIVVYGGLFGIGERFSAVPHDAITLDPALKVARLNVTEATLHANSFTPGQWPALSDPSYSQQLARAYGTEPSTVVLGFVPPVAAAPTPRSPERPAARSTTPPVSGTTPTTPATPATPPATIAEPMENELMGTFDLANVKTVEGTVTEIGKVRSATRGHDLLWLRVRTNEGQTLLVNAGPRDYVSKQDFYIVKGDRVRLTGSEVQATAVGKRVFIPSEIMHENHVLRLHSATGTPLWEGQMTTTPEAPQPGAMEPSSREPQSRAEPSGTTALGYTPAEDRTTTGAGAPGRAAEPSPTQFAPAGIIALGAFDLSNLRNIDGTVMEVGKSQAAGGPDTIWLRVKATDGQLINIQLGPRDYITKQGFFVVTGDRIRLSGWNVHATAAPSTTPVFVVANISYDNQTLNLRNRNGEPLWTATQPGASGQRGSTVERSTTEQAPETTTPGMDTETDEPEDSDRL